MYEKRFWMEFFYGKGLIGRSCCDKKGLAKKNSFWRKRFCEEIFCWSKMLVKKSCCTEKCQIHFCPTRLTSPLCCQAKNHPKVIHLYLWRDAGQPYHFGHQKFLTVLTEYVLFLPLGRQSSPFLDSFYAAGLPFIAFYLKKQHRPLLVANIGSLFLQI